MNDTNGAGLVVGHQTPTPGPHHIPTEEPVRSMQVAENRTDPPPGRRLQLIRAGDGDPRHGRVSSYVNHFCRCVECRGAWATYHRELRKRRRATLRGE